MQIFLLHSPSYGSPVCFTLECSDSGPLVCLKNGAKSLAVLVQKDLFVGEVLELLPLNDVNAREVYLHNHDLFSP